MSRLEDDLRATLRTRATDAHGAPPPWNPPARRPWSSRPWFVPAVAAASAIVFVAGASVAVTALSSGSGSAPGPASTAGATPSPSASDPSAVATVSNDAPVGQQAISYRGVEVYVPDEFVRAVARCDGYDTSVVVIGESAACATPPPDSLETPVVRLASSDSAWAREYTPLLTRGITLGGERAFVEAGCSTCREGALRGTSLVHFPDQRVVVAVSTWDVDLAAEILETAHVVSGG